MPMTLTTPETIAQPIDTLEINSFATDLDRLEIHVSFDKGFVAGGAFVPVIKDQLLTIGPSDFAATVAATDAIANAMPPGAVSVYGAIKEVLYAKIAELTGLAGIVT